MIGRASVFALLLVAVLLPSLADAAPRCGPPPPAGARWFYLGAPGASPHAKAARDALRAILEAFEGSLLRDPRCLRVVVNETGELQSSAQRLSRHALPERTVGFHNGKLGADSTVFVTPTAQIPLSVVMVHEALHALSHRYTAEARKHRLTSMIEGATQYITRSLVVTSLGQAREQVRSGYDSYVSFFELLLGRLGEEGPTLLADAYLTEGYEAFERAVDQRLDISLRSAARALERDDLAGALQRIGAPAPRGR